MSKLTAIGVAALPLGLLFAAPAQAQDAAVNGVLTVYGEDPCPPDVICVRAPENERFRIPKHLRDTVINPRNESSAVRMQSVVTDNPTGIGSCSAVGPGGSTGCHIKKLTAAKAEARARKKLTTDLPLP